MRIVETDVNDFLADNEDADEQMLEDNLGTPEELSRSFLDSMETKDVNDKLKKAKSVRGILIATACVALALLIGMIIGIYLVVKANLSHPVYYDHPNVDPTTPYVVVEYE